MEHFFNLIVLILAGLILIVWYDILIGWYGVPGAWEVYIGFLLTGGLVVILPLYLHESRRLPLSAWDAEKLKVVFNLCPDAKQRFETQGWMTIAEYRELLEIGQARIPASERSSYAKPTMN
jgi:hypothetical protein